MGIGDWGLGIGDWANPQSPIPNPQSPMNFIYNYNNKINNYEIKTIKFYLLMINILDNTKLLLYYDENSHVLNSPNFFLLKTAIPRF